MKKMAILWLVLLLLCIGVWTAACVKGSKESGNAGGIESGPDSSLQANSSGETQQDKDQSANTASDDSTDHEPAAPSVDEAGEQAVDDQESGSGQQPADESTGSVLDTMSIEEIKEAIAARSYNFEDGRVATLEKSDDLLALINKKNDLPADYEPVDLVVPEVLFAFEEFDQKKQMRQEAAAALEKLFEASLLEGLELYAQSGYRSYARQESIYASNVANMGEEEANKVSAKPGQSEHQSGLAMDVTCAAVGFDLVEAFGETPEGQWLKDNAQNYGFIIRYPKEQTDITQYSYEPWHLRYVGKTLAAYLYENDMTLDAFCESLE